MDNRPRYRTTPQGGPGLSVSHQSSAVDAHQSGPYGKRGTSVLAADRDSRGIEPRWHRDAEPAPLIRQGGDSVLEDAVTTEFSDGLGLIKNEHFSPDRSD